MATRRTSVPPALKNDQSKWSDYPRIARWSAAALIAWDLAWLFVLAFLLLGWYQHWLSIDELPARIGGVFPIILPWAGALGGLAISLVGLSAHFASWGPRAIKDQVASAHPGFAQRLDWNAWHVTRVFVGAVFGSVAALILVFVLRVLGVDDAGDPDTSLGATLTLLAVAFIVGYRDRTFRDLADRVIDTVFGPGGSREDAAVSFDLDATEVTFGDVPVNTHKDSTVTITNNNARVLRASSIAVRGTGFTLESAPHTVGAYADAPVVVRFTPTAAADAEGTLTIALSGVERSVPLKGNGTSG